MLSTILLVLKIIGIIIAVLIGIVLLLLLIPFKYVGKGDFSESKKAGISLIWLLFVIRGGLFYEDGDVRVKVRLLGIPFYNKKIIEAQEDEVEEESKDKKESKNKKGSKDDIETDDKKKSKKQDKKESVVENTDNDINISETISEKSDQNEESDGGVLNKIKNIKVLIKKLISKFKDAKRLIKSKGCKMAVSSTKITLVKLLKHLKPNKIESKMTFGFETPDKTGQVTAILAILYGLIEIDNEKFSVQPDFENKVLDGHFYVRGRIVMGYVLFQALQLYLKREIKFMIKQLKSLASFD